MPVQWTVAILLVGTTNLDARRPIIWNLGKIAASGRPGALGLVHSILVASAAIPGAFPPVPFDTVYMRQLFQVGYGMAMRGYSWAKVPPGWTAPEIEPPLAPPQGEASRSTTTRPAVLELPQQAQRPQ